MLRLSTYIYTLAISIAILHIKIYIKFTGQSWLNLEKYISDIYSSRFIKKPISIERYNNKICDILLLIRLLVIRSICLGWLPIHRRFERGIDLFTTWKNKSLANMHFELFFYPDGISSKNIVHYIYIFFLSFCENNNRKFHLNSVFVLKKRRKERKEERNE